jgi:hypothetical protein
LFSGDDGEDSTEDFESSDGDIFVEKQRCNERWLHASTSMYDQVVFFNVEILQTSTNRTMMFLTHGGGQP